MTEYPTNLGPMDIEAGIYPGGRVFRYICTGSTSRGERYDPQPLTVVRVNRMTVTVRTDQGSKFRIPRHLIEGRWAHDEEVSR